MLCPLQRPVVAAGPLRSLTRACREKPSRGGTPSVRGLDNKYSARCLRLATTVEALLSQRRTVCSAEEVQWYDLFN